MKKTLTALLIALTATSAAAFDNPNNINLSHKGVQFANGGWIYNFQYQVDLVNRILSDGTTNADIAECNSWTHTDRGIVFRSDYANLSGCHFIMHATYAGLLEGYSFNPSCDPDQYLCDRRRR